MICPGCDRILEPENKWYRRTRAERRQIAATHAGHQGRGMCSPCYHRARNDGSLVDHRCQVRLAAEVIEDWTFLAPTLPQDVTRKERIRLAAGRLGMTYSALERALLRAGIRADGNREAA